MRATRDGNFNKNVQLFKSLVFTVLIVYFIKPTIQSSNVFFPSYSTQHNAKVPNSNYEPTVPVLNPNNNGSPNNNVNSNTNYYNGGGHSVFEMGDTGIFCNDPGRWVKAEDKCNSCLCAANGQLSSVCTRALCPPGFPSTIQQSQLKVF